MKKTIKWLSVVIALLMVLTVALAACHPDDPTPGPTDSTEPLIELSDYRSYLLSELASLKGRLEGLDSATTAKVTSAYNAGVTAINAGTDTKTVLKAFNDAKAAIAQSIPLANGIYDYTKLTTEQKTDILGLLEGYGVNTGITGMTLYENGGLVMYNPRITLGTENYIPGYGFGVLAEGSITSDLETEDNAAWKRYYHTYNSQDPGTANYWDANDSEIASFYSYIGAGFYTNFMNETKDGYDWVPELAIDETMTPADEGGNGVTSRSWTFRVRKDVKYNTLGKHTEFNDRQIQMEDYLTPFKALLNGANGLFRGEEMANSTGAGTIAGAKAYFEATKNGDPGINETADFSKVGLKIEEKDGDWWFTVTYTEACTAFYARYYISSGMYMPLPKEFLDIVTVKNYLGFNSDKSESPVDNSLSLGAYTLERWDSGEQVVYKKNPNYVYASTKYSIPGIHINILEAAKTDEEAGFKEFLANKIDSSGIPQTKLTEYASDPRTKHTTGDTTLKLNFNALDQDTWNELFGENGTVTQTPAADTWQCEPALSNSHFRNALSYAIDRNTFAAIRGAVSSVSYLSSAYMSDPENNIAYNLTDAHEKAVAGLLDGTDSGGYSLELARDYFRMALDELEASGAYTRGTKENPTVIELEIAWWNTSMETTYHQYIKQYWEDAFNHDSVSGGCYKLNVKFWCSPTGDPNDAYDRIQSGQFDIGFGAIEGNTLDPLSFMQVMSSDLIISTGFTLNWGADTSDPDSELLVYNGLRWSFDALYTVTQTPSQVVNGKLTGESFVGVGDGSFELDVDNVTAVLTVEKQAEVKLEDVDFYLFGYKVADNDDGYEYVEFSVKEFIQGQPVANADGTEVTYTLSIPVTQFAVFDFAPYLKNVGIDLYASFSIEGKLDTTYLSYVDGWNAGLAFGSVSYTTEETTEDVVATFKALGFPEGTLTAANAQLVGYTKEGDGDPTKFTAEATVTVSGPDEKGVYTITVKIAKADYSKLFGGTIDDDDYSGAQGFTVDITIATGWTITFSAAHAFVSAPAAE